MRLPVSQHSYQAYSHLPGIGNKRYLEDFFILLFSEYQWGWAFFPPFKNHPHFHFCEQKCVFVFLLGCWIWSWLSYRISFSIREISPLSETLIEKTFPTLEVVFLLCWWCFCQILFFFTISNLTLLFHGSWVLSEIFKRLPFSKFLGKKS